MEEDYVKMLFVDNLVITILAIFVLVYIYYNWGIVTSDKFYLNGNFSNPVLITAVIILLSLLIIGDKYEKKSISEPMNIRESVPLIQPSAPPLPEIKAPVPAVGGVPNFKIKSNDIFVPYNQKSMYMDVNV